MAEPTNPKSAPLTEDTRREPYVKPGIAWEEALEDRPNLIAACAQKPAESDECNASPFS